MKNIKKMKITKINVDSIKVNNIDINNFIQIPNWIMLNPTLKPNEKLLLGVIYSNDISKWFNTKSITERLSISHATFYRLQNSLIKKGIISINGSNKEENNFSVNFNVLYNQMVDYSKNNDKKVFSPNVEESNIIQDNTPKVETPVEDVKVSKNQSSEELEVKSDVIPTEVNEVNVEEEEYLTYDFNYENEKEDIRDKIEEILKDKKFTYMKILQMGIEENMDIINRRFPKLYKDEPAFINKVLELIPNIK